jgi:tetratricopeptide (TPR) repeat protein
MSNSASSPQPQPVSSDHVPDPQFMTKLEEVIGSFAEATNAGRDQDANAAAMQALAMAAAEQLRNPSPEVLLMDEADDLESKGDWPAAEAVRRKVLALEESSGHSGKIAGAQMKLGKLLRIVGRDDEAWQFVCAATASARRAKIFPLLVTALLGEAFCALDRGDSARALTAAAEAVQVVGPGRLHDHERARALTARARCRLAQGDLTGAQSDLASGWDLLLAHSGSWMLPGIMQTLAMWWEVKGRLEERLGNFSCASEATTTAIELYRQRGDPHALLALARSLEKLGEIAREAGDLAAEQESLSEANSIRCGLHLSPKRPSAA